MTAVFAASQRDPTLSQGLKGYNILDTLPELAYDDITVLAAHLCEMPTALVSLVDSDRQWFKSRVGLSAAETPRKVAFCDHTIQHSDILIVEDATQDPRFSHNPLVTRRPLHSLLWQARRCSLPMAMRWVRSVSLTINHGV